MNQFTKYLLASLLGGIFAGGTGITMSIILNFENNDLRKQIEQRDSVNTHNVKVIESLHEYIRVDSLTQLEQLNPTK